MKAKIVFDNMHQHEHDHDAEKANAKKPPLKAKAMNQKSQKNNVKAHRKAMSK